MTYSNYGNLPSDFIKSKIVHKYIRGKDEISYNYANGNRAFINIREGILYVYNECNKMIETKELKDKDDLEFLKNSKKAYKDLERKEVSCSIF